MTKKSRNFLIVYRPTKIDIVFAGVRLLRLNVNPKGYGHDSNKIPIHEPNLANITVEDTGKTGWLSD